MRKSITTITIIALSIFAIMVLNGCDSDYQSAPAYFEIISKSNGTTSSGMYYVEIIVKNTGGGAGKNVECKVTVEDMDSGKIYGDTSTIFEGGRNIEAGDEATAKAVFPESGFLGLIALEGTTPLAEGEKGIKLFYSYELTWEDVLP